MRMTPRLAVFVIAVSSFVACGNPGGTADTASRQSLTAPSALSASVKEAASTRQVTMMDACDGPTFNLAIGPGTCGRNGGVAFSAFVAEITAHHFAGAWHNSPSQSDAWLGDALIATNNGGETHTFTRVADFGGGIVPFLNELAETPHVAPECTTERTFVPPGGADSRPSTRWVTSSSSAASIPGCTRQSS